MGNYDYKFFYRRNLPHYQPTQAKFFITFRLADSLPRVVIEELLAYKKQLDQALEKINDQQQKRRLRYENHRRWFGKYDDYLDRAATGPKWLADPRIAKLVDESIKFRDQKDYHLDAFCIMPNHVHLVIEPLNVAQSAKLRGKADAESGSLGHADVTQFGELRYRAGVQASETGQRDDRQFSNPQPCGMPISLSRILHSLKLYTSRRANMILAREGRFWLHENYDHVVRDEGEWLRIMSYVINNPVKAKLVDSWDKWPWSYCKYL